MFRLLILLALVCVLGACSNTYPDYHDGQEVLQQADSLGGFEKVDGYDVFPLYEIRPGDVLDILYSFNVEQKDTFHLLPQDVIRIKFPSLPELNEEQSILPDGSIYMPYIGKVQATGISPQELQQKLRKLYKGVLREPNLTVFVSEYGGKIAELKRTITNAPRGQSKLLNVRSDGYASFPMIGEMKVAGKTFPVVNQEINDLYRKVTEDLHVDLLLFSTADSRITVLGQVGTPGTYDIFRPTSVLEAIGLAGGQTNDSELGRVIAMRKQGEQVLYRVVDVAALLSGEHLYNRHADSRDGEYEADHHIQPHTKEDIMEKHVYLKAGDIVFVPRRRLATAASIAAEIGQIMYFNGWGVSLGASYDLTPIVNDRWLNVSPLEPVEKSQSTDQFRFQNQN